MTTRDPIEATGIPDALDQFITTWYDQVSHKLAGGERSPWQDVTVPVGDGILPDNEQKLAQPTDWLDAAQWAQADPTDPSTFDINQIPQATGEGHDGAGLDWYSGVGQAPNNYVNRNNPLYAARRDFGKMVNKQIIALFGVEGTAGYIRKPAAGDAAPGGRAVNSDHQSGGAIDYFGTESQLTALRNWLVTQPWVSFVRYKTESHYDHLHMSISLPWVAANYFQNQEYSIAPPVFQQQPTETNPATDQQAMRTQAAKPEVQAPLPNEVRPV